MRAIKEGLIRVALGRRILEWVDEEGLVLGNGEVAVKSMAMGRRE